MGNQITFSPDKEKSPSSAEGELEMENIQLRNTNRKLISKLDQQKQLIKKLNSQLDAIKKSKELNDSILLKRQCQDLKNKNDNLETLLFQSKQEIAKLKKDLVKLGSDSKSKNSSRWDKLKNIRK